MGEVVVQRLNELSELDSGIHWFCPRSRDDEGGVYFDEDVLATLPNEKEASKIRRQQKVREAHQRRDKVLEGCKIFAFDGEDARDFQDTFGAGLKRQLTRCDICVREYHRSRNLLVQTLEAHFDGEEVMTFMDKFDRMNIDRIGAGLKYMANTLEDLPIKERNIAAAGDEGMYALFEALNCVPFLKDEEAMELYFDRPFRLVQTNKKIKLPNYAPGMTAFLFSRNEERCAWALRNFASVKRPLTGTDFEYGVKPFLEPAIRRVHISCLDKRFLLPFWRGTRLIINKLTQGLVAKHLRSVDSNLYTVGLEHFQIDDQHFGDLLSSYQALIDLGPSEFWDAMGTIHAQSVVETTFRAPNLQRLLKTTQEDAPLQLEEKLHWTVQIVTSVKPGNLMAPIRTILERLLKQLQRDEYSQYAQTVCFEKGLACILRAVESLLDRIPGGPIVTHMIQLISEDYMKLIMQELDGIEKKQELQFSNSEVYCLEIIEKGLALDISGLARDRKTIDKTRTLDHELGMGNLNLWRMSLRHIKPGNPNLPGSVLSGLSGLLPLEKFSPRQIKAAPKHAEAWNFALQKILRHVCGDLLEPLDSFSPAQLDELFGDGRACTGLVALLFSGESEVHQAALDVLKTLTGRDGRRDSIHHVLDTFYPQAMHAINSAIGTISRFAAFEPSPVALKICTDIFSCLCDRSDGILRSSKSLSEEGSKQFGDYWRSTWLFLGMIFEQTEPWSNRGYDKHMMTEFCRETMDFADHAFDQYSIIASTLQGSEYAPHGEDVRRKLMESPKSIFGQITKWLRLRDEYLITKAVTLASKMLGRLREINVRIDDDAAQYIEDVVTGFGKNAKIKTNVTMQQKAELHRALEKHLGVSLAIDVDDLAGKPMKQKSVQDWIGSGRSSGASTPTSVSGKPSKAESLDFNAWSEAAKRKKEMQAAEDDAFGSMQTSKDLKKMQAQEQLKQKQQQRSGLGPATVKAAQKHQQDTKNFLAERKREKEESERRRQANLAKSKGVGVGSGVQGLGDIGKDHDLKGQNVMLSSDESSEDEDDFDAELFGPIKTKDKRIKSDADKGANIGLPPEAKNAPLKIQRIQRNARDMRARLAPDLSTLHKTMLAWDFFHTGDFPPGFSENQAKQVEKIYKDPVTYQQTFLPLLTLEAWQGLSKERADNTNKPYEFKVSTRTNVDSFLEVTSSMSQAEQREAGLSEADIVLLSATKVKLTGDGSVPHALARIYRVKREKASFQVVYQTMPGTSLASSLQKGTSVFGIKITSNTPLEREYGALQSLQYYDLCMQILRASPSPKIHLNDREVQSAMNVWALNPAQSVAVNASLQNEGFSLIQGPPGTGKTKTITAIVGGLLSQVLSGTSAEGSRISVPGATNNNATSSASKKLLVCAPSNAAVDEIVMRLKKGVKTKNGREHQINVVRLGKSERINANVADVTMDELVKKKMGSNDSDQKKKEANQAVFKEHQEVSAKLNAAREKEREGTAQGQEAAELRDAIGNLARKKKELSSKIDNIKDSETSAGREAELNKKRARQAVLDQAHVICATLSGSGHDMFQSLNIEFETVIIDEAAQCVEMASLIPLKYGCVKCVMVGDPKQLPPTVLSKEAQRFQYEQSLFVRMQLNYPEVVYLLDTQYRMHPDISVFPSRSFYDGMLKDGGDNAIRTKRPWHANGLFAPYRFYDVKGRHEKATKGHSLVNHAEIDVAIAMFERLTAEFRSYDFRGKIGVITPYKAQHMELKARFSKRFGNEILETIEFNTTDAFQGREAEIIIFSCVRASVGNTVGFLQDIRRMNVGLTRAQSSLWVLGNSDALLVGQWWKKLIEDAQARRAYISGDVMSLLNRPSQTLPPQIDGSAAARRSQSEATGAANPGSRGSLSSAPAASVPQPSAAPPRDDPTRVEGERMDGIRYRFEDRIPSQKKTNGAALKNADVGMDDSTLTAADAATSSESETPLPASNGIGGRDEMEDKRRSNQVDRNVKPRPVVPQPPPPVRKRPAPNPFMPKPKHRRPG